MAPVNPSTCLAYLIFSCCYVGAALKAAVVNCRACGARMLFNIIGGFHAQTSERGSGMRQAGNRCHLAPCAGLEMGHATTRRSSSLTGGVIANSRLPVGSSFKRIC